MSTRETVNVLVVDDDEVDVMMIQRAFERTKVVNKIVFASDGIEALELLRGESIAAIPRPYLVLLDINMPRMNGIEFLEALRSDENLKDTTVFVLTTSADKRDQCAAYRENVAGYIVKSNTGEEFTDLVQLIDHYSRVVELPPNCRRLSG